MIREVSLIAMVAATRAVELAGRLPLRRVGCPDEIAQLVLFLASDESLSCTGADYAVDAGGSAGKRTKF